QLDGMERSNNPGWARSLFSWSTMTRSVGTLRAHPMLPLLAALGASFSIVQACLMAFVATYAVTQHGASLAEAGRVVAVMHTASMAGRILMGWAADRVGGAMRHLAIQAVAS